MKKLLIALFLLGFLIPCQAQLTVTGCCDYLIVEWNIPGAAKLVIRDDRHERIKSIGQSGIDSFYVVDAIEVRDVNNAVLGSQYVQNCCAKKYRIENDFLYFLAAGEFTVNKMMGYGSDIRWARVYRNKNESPTQTWIGKGTFQVTWTSQNKSYRTFDTVRNY